MVKETAAAYTCTNGVVAWFSVASQEPGVCAACAEKLGWIVVGAKAGARPQNGQPPSIDFMFPSQHLQET